MQPTRCIVSCADKKPAIRIGITGIFWYELHELHPEMADIGTNQWLVIGRDEAQSLVESDDILTSRIVSLSVQEDLTVRKVLLELGDDIFHHLCLDV